MLFWNVVYLFWYFIGYQEQCWWHIIPTIFCIEVISYDKLVRDAKQRNQILFDKLFNPKVNEVLNLLIKCLKISDGSYENELRDSIINAYKKFNIN